MKFYIYLLIIICVIFLFFIIKEKRIERLDLIDTNSDPIQKLKDIFGDNGLGKIKTFFDDVKNGKIGEEIKKAFEPVGAVQGPCPPRSDTKWWSAGDCIADGPVDREDSRNDGETLGIHADDKPGGRDGCSWNRHREGILCFRDCPNGYYGRATEKCWANGADSFGVMKRSSDRWQCPPPGNTTHTKLAGLFCYKP